MSPRTEEQYEEIRIEKRELILQTALEMFALKGFENTSISMIAKKAGISKGLLYNYFESKEDLLSNIMNRGIDEVIAVFDLNNDGLLEPGEMKFFIHEMFQLLREKRIFWRLYYQISFQESAFAMISSKIDELYQPMMAIMVRYFKSMGFENPEMEVMLFSALLDGISFDYIMKPELIPLQDIEKEIVKRYCEKK
jgi:AcrR family transcriptional regulator